MAGPDDPRRPPPPESPPPGGRSAAGGPGERPELQRALGELEGAMRRLAGDTQRELTDRAVDAIHEATGRIKSLERKRDRRAERRERRFERRYGVPSAQLSEREQPDAEPEGRGRRRVRRLYRVPHEGVIAGVCAGIARRMGLETWVVRCFAVTGLVFMPQFVFIGYWVLCFTTRTLTPAEASVVYSLPSGSGGRMPIPGYDRGVSPRDRLRGVRETFDGIEQRLRRMEGYVTSSRYELERELKRIED